MVTFTPSKRTKGLYQNTESVGGIIQGQTKKIKEIKEEMYLYFKHGTGGWPWNEFFLKNKK